MGVSGARSPEVVISSGKVLWVSGDVGKLVRHRAFNRRLLQPLTGLNAGSIPGR